MLQQQQRLEHVPCREFFRRATLIDGPVSSIETMLTLAKQGKQQSRLLTVFGPSGSGKSSVVMAGLLPRDPVSAGIAAACITALLLLAAGLARRDARRGGGHNRRPAAAVVPNDPLETTTAPETRAVSHR